MLFAVVPRSCFEHLLRNTLPLLDRQPESKLAGLTQELVLANCLSRPYRSKLFRPRLTQPDNSVQEQPTSFSCQKQSQSDCAERRPLGRATYWNLKYMESTESIDLHFLG